MSVNFWFAFVDTLIAAKFSQTCIHHACGKIATVLEILRRTEAVDFPFWHKRPSEGYISRLIADEYV